MFKRIQKFLTRGRKGGVTAPPPKPEYDFSKPFRIAIPVIVEVPLGPLDNFSERAQKQILDKITELQKQTRKAMFHPMPNGTLRLYVPEEGVKETVN